MKKLFTLLFLLGATLYVSAQTTYYSEDFNAGLPADWANPSANWSIDTPAGVSSQFFTVPAADGNVACFNDDGLGNGALGGGALTTGEIDLSMVTGPMWLEMNSFFPNLDYTGLDETAKILISSDGTTWNEIADLGGGEGANFGVAFVDISMYAGGSVWLQFVYDDGQAWNYGWAIDNVTISDELTLVPSRSFGLHAGGAVMMDQALEGIEYINSGFIYNRGVETINSYDIVMTNGTETITSNISGVNIEYNQTVRYTATEAITVSGNQTWTVTLQNVNGSMDADDDPSDNSMDFNLNAMTVNPDKGVAVEEATGTWCTWCPRGTVFLEEMSKRFGHHFAGVAVHNGDPMVLTAYDNAITSFNGFQGFPSVIYQRESVEDPSAIVTPSLDDMAVAPPARLVVGAALDGDNVTASLEVQFLEDEIGADYNILVVVTEDNVTGEGADWAQINAYSGGGNGPMGGFELLPGAVPDELMVYNHVGRALIGNFAGVGDTIAGDFTANQITGYIFEGDTYNLGGVDPENFHLVGLLVASNGQIVNAISTKLNDALANGLFTPTVSNNEVYDSNLAQVNPNPVKDMATITMSLDEASDISVSVMNSLGQQVSTMNYGSMSGTFNLDYNMSNLATGVYYMHIQAGDKFMSKKLTKVE